MDNWKMVFLDNYRFKGLIFLERNTINWCASVKHNLRALKIEFKFLKVFLYCREVKVIEDEDLIDRIQNILAVIDDVGDIIESLYTESDCERVSLDLDRWLIYMLHKIDLIKPEIEYSYRLVSLSSNSVRGFYFPVTLLDHVLQNLKDLRQYEVKSILGEKKFIDVLEGRLIFLKNSFGLADKLNIAGLELIYEAGDVATAAASFLFRCWINKMDGDEEPERLSDDFCRSLIYKPDRVEASLYLGILKESELLPSDVLLVGLADFLSELLIELLNRDVCREVPMTDQLESLDQEVKFLRSLIPTTPMEHADYGKLYVECIIGQLNEIVCYSEELYVGNLVEETIDNGKLRGLLKRLKLIKSFCLMERVSHEANFIAPMKYQFESLCNYMRLLRNFLNHMQRVYEDDKQFNDILSHAEAMVLEAGSIMYSLYVNEFKDNVAKEMSSRLPDFLENIRLIAEDVIKIHPNAASSYFLIENRGQRDTKVFRKELDELLNVRDDTNSDYLQAHIKKAAKMSSGIYFLLQHLAELLSHDSVLEIPMKDQFESLHQELKLLRNLLRTPTQYADYERSCLIHAIIQVNKFAHLIGDLYVGNISEAILTMNNAILVRLLGRLKLLNSFCLMDRVNNEATMIAPMKDQFVILYEDMRLLRIFLIHTEKDAKFEDIQSRMEDMALQAGSALYIFSASDIKEDVIQEMSYLWPDSLDNIKLIKADMRKIYPDATPSNFAKTGGQKGLKVFLQELKMVLNSRADIITRFVTPYTKRIALLQMEKVQNELKKLISFLENPEESGVEIGQLEVFERRVTSITNVAKYVADPIFFRDYPVWYCMLKLSDFMEDVKMFKREIERVNEKIYSEMVLSQNDNTLPMSEVIVGFENEAEDMIDQLIRGSKQRTVISIVGMGGLGKTTLARKLYSNEEVDKHFDFRAWCIVSQDYQPEQMLKDILGQVTEEINVKSGKGLDERLYQCLKGRRYLIVMDDIWDIKAWTSLRQCFVDDRNGSRIILTTRLQEIASNTRTSSIPHLLRHFNEDESRELLTKKLFHGGKCPREHLEIVKQISKNCKGLPLSVVLMAGVLASKNKEEWKQVAESLSQNTDGDMQNLSMAVLKVSYTNLPDHLRPCFLYLGAFPEDREILAKKLTWLWVAEGYIQDIEQKNAEEIAEDYLKDLIGRSLVIVAERGFRGRIKACRIHDLVRSFSLAKAKEKNLLVLDGNGGPVASPEIKGHQQVESNYSNLITDDQYRVCVYSMPNDFDEWPSSLHVCSLLDFTPAFPVNFMSSYDASFIIRSFKFLNVLDLGRFLLKDLNCDIDLLVHLRLLAARIQSNSIPASISNLSSLETLIVKGIRDEVQVPYTIWSMVSLRHLHIDNRASLMWDIIDAKVVALDKLETLSTPSLPCGEKSRKMIRSLLNLRKLKCIFMDVDNSNNFPDLDSLIQLESVKVFYHGEKLPNGIFSFPSNLKKLTLSKFQLPWSDIATIGTLPNLEVLKLLFRAFDGKVWETRANEFPKLKYLKLEALDIEQWIVAAEDHFPRLEKVVVHRCKLLEEIPSSVGISNTILMIEVKWCNTSAANSARDIYDEHQDMGNESFKVNIHPYPSNEGAASSS